MSKKNYELVVDLGFNPFQKAVFSQDDGKPKPDKRSRFAQLPLHVIKYCFESGNPGLLGVISYLAMNSYNSEWRYNVAGICNSIGLKRHCVTKWVKNLKGLGVLKPVKHKGYANCYTLEYGRYVELFERESDLSFMSIESPRMSIQTTALSIESTPDVDSNAINRIEKENVEKKGIIDGDQPFFTNALSLSNNSCQPICNRTEPIHSCESIGPVSFHELDAFTEPAEMFESDDFNEPTEVYESSPNSSPPLSLFQRSTAVPNVVKLHGSDLERDLERHKIQREREQEQERRNKRYADFLVKQKKYASHLEYLEQRTDISASNKASCLREALTSLKRAGSFQPERGFSYDAPLIVDNRGVDLAEKFFEANPLINAACVMGIVQQLVEKVRFDDESTETWDACQLEKKCLKLSYFFNCMDEIITKNRFEGLPASTNFVTDVRHQPKSVTVKKAV